MSTPPLMGQSTSAAAISREIPSAGSRSFMRRILLQQELPGKDALRAALAEAPLSRRNSFYHPEPPRSSARCPSLPGRTVKISNACAVLGRFLHTRVWFGISEVPSWSRRGARAKRGRGGTKDAKLPYRRPRSAPYSMRCASRISVTKMRWSGDGLVVFVFFF